MASSGIMHVGPEGGRPLGGQDSHAMGWFFLVSSLFWPRVFILAFWIFDDELLKDAFSSWVIPAVGFLLAPWTTIAYMSMWGLSSDRVSGAEWAVVAIAVLLDVLTYVGAARLKRSS